MKYYLVIQFNADMPNNIEFDTKDKALDYCHKELGGAPIAWVTYNVGFVKMKNVLKNDEYVEE